MNLKQAVVFAILMEGNDGILGKAPVYIYEKLQQVEMNKPEVLLDMGNLAKFRAWEFKWKPEWITKEY